MSRFPVWAIPCLLACTNGLDTSIAITAECASGPDVSLHWAMTAGECGIRPGAIELAGEVGVEPMPTVLGAGEYCVWALAVDAGCRVVGGTSTGITLPEDRGTVNLELDEESCVSPEERPAWDLLVSASAGCAPSCEADRCECNGASSCDGDLGYCPTPLSGELLDTSNTHTCLARRGASELHCWAGGLPVSIATPSPIEELTVGTDFVCYLEPEDGMDPGSILCSEATEDGFGPWRSVDRPPSCAAGSAANMLLSGIRAGNRRVCAFAENSSTQGIACWGDPISGALGIQLDDCTAAATDGIAGPVLYRPPSSRWVDLAVDEGAVCALRYSGEVDCGGSDAPATPLPFEADLIELRMAGGRLCGRAVGGRIFCTGGLSLPGRWLAFDIAVAEDGTETVCARRPNGALQCIETTAGDTETVTEITVPFSAMAVAPGRVCSNTTSGSGGVACFSVGDDGAPPETQAATPGKDWVCPDA